jgi:predicted dithiol-disulfide oxidoreductase (DUF899 family)
MCTSLLSAWDGEVAHVEQRIALAIVARSRIERLVAFKKERGWCQLKLYSDVSGDYTDVAAFNSLYSSRATEGAPQAPAVVAPRR